MRKLAFFFKFVESFATGIVLSYDNCNLCLYSICFGSPGLFFLRKLSRKLNLISYIKKQMTWNIFS